MLNLQKKYLKNDSGITLFESLLALVILSVLGFVLISGVIQANNLIRKIQSSALYTSNILSLDNTLRKALSEIRIPFWINNPEIEENINSLEIPYLYGIKENILNIYEDDGFIYIQSEIDENMLTDDTAVFNSYFGPFDNIDINLSEDKLVMLEIFYNNKNPVNITAGFSTVLFITEEEE